MFKKCVIFLFLATAYTVLLTHNFTPHIHHSKQETDHHEDGKKHYHNDNNEEQNDDNSQKRNHGIFSFAQLDENFVPAKAANNKFELPVTFLSALVITGLSEKSFTNSQIIFGSYIEYPPPDKILPSSLHRGPPIV